MTEEEMTELEKKAFKLLACKKCKQILALGMCKCNDWQEEISVLRVSDLIKIKEKRIRQIKRDSRYPTKNKPAATIQINAPLALIQLELETEVSVLEREIQELRLLEKNKKEEKT